MATVTDALIREAIPEAWHVRPAELTASGQHRLTYARIREAHRTLPRISELLADPWAYCAVLERAAVIDPWLFHPLLLHYTLTTAPVLRFGDPQRTSGLLDALESLSVTGCAAMTEASRSNSHLELRTTATHDPARGGFVLHTPDASAVKKPVMAAHAGGGKLAAVYARLVVGGADCGVFVFAVPLRGADGRAVPGVRIQPMVENSLLTADFSTVAFDHVRLPAESWLDDGARIEDGVFHDPAGDVAARLRRTMSIGPGVWRGISAMAAAVSRSAAVMALRYSMQHTTTGRLAPELPLIGYRTQRNAVFTALATAWAATVAAEHAKGRRDAARTGGSTGSDGSAGTASSAGATWAPWSSVDQELALVKVITTELADRVLDRCRRHCGSSGTLETDHLNRYRGLIQGYATAGGDNQLILLDTGRALAEAPERSPLRTPAGASPAEAGLALESCRELARVAESLLQRRLRGRVVDSLRRGEDRFTAWNRELELTLDTATAACDRLLLDLAAAALGRAAGPDTVFGEDALFGEDTPAVLGALATVFALDWAERRCGLLSDLGLLSPGELGRIRAAREVGCDVLLPHAERLAAAYGPPAGLLIS